jgi:hypothetical protein
MGAGTKKEEGGLGVELGRARMGEGRQSLAIFTISRFATQIID